MKAVQIARQTGRLAVRSLSAAVAPQQAILRRRLGSSFAHPASNPSRSLILRRGYATSTAEPSSVNNPATVRAGELLELANRALEDGDVDGAKALYKQSCEVEATPTGWYNLGVCEYHLKDIEGAIVAWEKSLALSPSPDAHTNIASAYIMSKPPRPADAIKHLTSALELAPEDPEIAFNLAAVLESTDNLDHALSLYKRAAEGGVERAQQNIRNVSAKILGKQAKSAEAEQK